MRGVEISTKEKTKKEEDHYTVKPIANGKKMTEQDPFFGKEKSLKIAENQSQQKGKPFLRTANENTFCYVWQIFMKFQYI